MSAARLGPWRLFRPEDDRERRFQTLAAAKQFAGAHLRLGWLEVEHETSGESWVREAGKWRCRREAAPGHGEPPA